MRNLLGLPAWLLRAAARALLVALSVTALGPLAHEVHQDDCDIVAVAHDESQHPLRNAATPSSALSGDHCVACHFARSSRGPVSWEPNGLTALDRGVLLYHSDGELRAAPSAAPLPARAPPAFA
jgi:hypothetical protein